MEQQYLAVHCRSDRAPTLTAHAILVLQPCYSYHPHRSAGAAARARRLHRKVKGTHACSSSSSSASVRLLHIHHTTGESEMHACMHHANSNGCAWHAMHAILLLPWRWRGSTGPPVTRTSRNASTTERRGMMTTLSRDRACMSMAWLRV